MPQLYYNPIPTLLINLLQYLFAPPPAQPQDPSIATTFYMVTMEDARIEQEDVTSMAFLVSLIMRAATTTNCKTAKKEVDQFVLDLHRNKLVTDNGEVLQVKDAAAILNRWAREISLQTKFPEDKIKAVLATLNQGAGYGAVASMIAEGGTRNGQPIMFSANSRSVYSLSSLERSGTTFTYYRSIPMHALLNDPNAQIDDEPDPNKPDLVVTTKVTIKMDYFSFEKPQGSAVTQTSAVQTRDPDIKFNSSMLPGFADCEVMGFQLLPDADMLEGEWVMASRLTA